MGEKVVHRDAQSPVTTARCCGSATMGSAEEPKRESEDKSDRRDMFGDDLRITKDLG